MPTLPLSVCVITCNEEANLERCLGSIHDLADEVVILDSGSTDGTRAVAEKYGATWHERDWTGFGDQRAAAIETCSRPWVLALDADEELSADLKASIIHFFEEDHERYAGAQFSRRVWFLGRWIYHGDWYPDRKLRLFLRENAVSKGNAGHDKIELSDGEVTILSGDLNHYSFPSLNSYIDKINQFSDAHLDDQLQKGRAWSLSENLFRPVWRFFRAYFLRRGFLDGFAGLWIATATAFLTFVRYSRTYEHERKSGADL